MEASAHHSAFGKVPTKMSLPDYIRLSTFGIPFRHSDLASFCLLHLQFKHRGVKRSAIQH